MWPSDDQARHAAALKLARFAVEHGQENRLLAYFQMALGMAEYRNGNFTAAEKVLLTVEKKHENHPHLAAPRSSTAR